MRMISQLFIFFIRVYQAVLSPFLGANCRHDPTCSQYGVQALKEWGAIKGTWLTIKRISKCRPRGTWGYDPVPKKEEQ